MGRWFLVAVTMLLAGPACAQAIDLAWDDCGVGGVTSKTFACSTNVGSEDLVASFAGFSFQAPIVAYNVDLIIQTPNDSLLPDWWMVGSGLCRAGAVAPGYLPSDGPGCANLGVTPDSTQQFFHSTLGFPNQAELSVVGYFSGGLQPTSGVEYLGARLRIMNTNAFGIGACGGCSDYATITLRQMVFLLSDGSVTTIRFSNRQNVVTWQTNTVPSLPKSWGQIKALYRR
ncbi:MAG TPA: hypothetical protein VFK69_02175 [Candidatus Eisenbacteria bacterium]|nr:hypothetical protein [Candidatus Eisenbacteria bacterium]